MIKLCPGVADQLVLFLGRFMIIEAKEYDSQALVPREMKNLIFMYRKA